MTDSTKSAPDLTEGRTAILRWLAIHKYGLTTQINAYAQPGKAVQHTARDLDWLVEAEMLESFKMRNPSGKGGRPGNCYLLREKGALAIGQRYGTHYERQPEWAQLVYLDLVLAFRAQCETLAQGDGGWTMTCPVNYNPKHPMPDPTPQYTALATVRTIWAYHRLHTFNLDMPEERWVEMRKAGETQKHLDGFSRAANDYVLTRLTPKAQAAVFILPRADVGGTFWKNRIAAYHALPQQHIPVFAVFAEEKDAQPWRDVMRDGGLRATLVERIPTVIQSIAAYAER